MKKSECTESRKDTQCLYSLKMAHDNTDRNTDEIIKPHLNMKPL